MVSMPLRARPPAATAAPLLIVLTGLLSACGSGGDDQGSGLEASYSGPTSQALADVVFLRLRNQDGRLIVLDVVARDITAPLDGFDLAIAFDAAVVAAFGALDQTFLGVCGSTRPDNAILLCADNIASTANQTGTLLFSAAIQDPHTPDTLSGDRVLATVSFRGVAPGTSSIDFYVVGRPAPGTMSVSRIVSDSDPNAAAAVEFVPDVPGQASIRVRRST